MRSGMDSYFGVGKGHVQTGVGQQLCQISRTAFSATYRSRCPMADGCSSPMTGRATVTLPDQDVGGLRRVADGTGQHGGRPPQSIGVFATGGGMDRYALAETYYDALTGERRHIAGKAVGLLCERHYGSARPVHRRCKPDRYLRLEWHHVDMSMAKAPIHDTSGTARARYIDTDNPDTPNDPNAWRGKRLGCHVACCTDLD